MQFFFFCFHLGIGTLLASILPAYTLRNKISHLFQIHFFYTLSVSRAMKNKNHDESVKIKLLLIFFLLIIFKNLYGHRGYNKLYFLFFNLFLRNYDLLYYRKTIGVILYSAICLYLLIY